MLATLFITVLTVAILTAQDTASVPYEQKIDVVYGEAHGTGLLMDVFTPKQNVNGLGIIDVVSGAYFSDRGKLRDHIMAQVYTVFGVRPGSRSRYTCLEMAEHVKTGIRYIKAHCLEYKIDAQRLGLTGASAGGHLATLATVTPEEANPEAKTLCSARAQASRQPPSSSRPPIFWIEMASRRMLEPSAICCFSVELTGTRRRKSKCAPARSRRHAW